LDEFGIPKSGKNGLTPSASQLTMEGGGPRVRETLKLGETTLSNPLLTNKLPRILSKPHAVKKGTIAFMV
jgi:hypothetical protein